MDIEPYGEKRSPVFALLPQLWRLVLTPKSHRDYGYTKMQLVILNALAARGTLNMSQIAEFIGASKEQATRAVAPMVDAGLAERIVPEENRTQVKVRLTDAGCEFMRGYFRSVQTRIHERLDASLTPEERAELRSSLETAAELLMKVE